MSYPINLNRTELEYLIKATEGNVGDGTKQAIQKKLASAKLKKEWASHATTLACLPKAMLEVFHDSVIRSGSFTKEHMAAEETLADVISAMK